MSFSLSVVSPSSPLPVAPACAGQQAREDLSCFSVSLIIDRLGEWRSGIAERMLPCHCSCSWLPQQLGQKIRTFRIVIISSRSYVCLCSLSSLFFCRYSGSHLMISSFSGMFLCLSAWFTQYFPPSDPCCVHVQAYMHRPLQKLFTLNLPLALHSFVSTSSWESNNSAACRKHVFIGHLF